MPGRSCRSSSVRRARAVGVTSACTGLSVRHRQEEALQRVPAQLPFPVLEGQEALDQPDPDQTALDQVLPLQVLPLQVLPVQVLPDQVLPDQVLPASEVVSAVKEPEIHCVLLNQPAVQAVRVEARIPIVPERHCWPKMSSSPWSGTPSMVRANPLR